MGEQFIYNKLMIKKNIIIIILISKWIVLLLQFKNVKPPVHSNRIKLGSNTNVYVGKPLSKSCHVIIDNLLKF